MVPTLVNVLKKNEDIYAFPIQADGSILGYNKTLWEDLGFSIDDVPQTLPDFIDFIVRWADEYAHGFPDVVLFHPLFSTKKQLFLWALHHYTLAFAPQGNELYFDIPLLQYILGKLDASSQVLEDMDRTISSQMGNAEEPDVLFNFYVDLAAPPYIENKWQPLLMTLGGTDTPKEVVQEDICLVNPYSRHPDMALALIECIAATMDEKTRVILYGDQATAVEDPTFQQRQKMFLEIIQNLEQMLQTALPDEKKDLEEQLEAVQKEYILYEQNFRWLVSPEAIKQYQKLVPYLRPDGDDPTLASVYMASGTLFDQYASGQISSSDFLEKLESIYQMVQLENK